jgi:hypothetical protein
MTDDYELLFRQATLSSLQGELAEAIEGFEACRRLRPQAVDPVIPLLDCYRSTGDMARANELAGELRRRWPTDGGALLAVARLKEEEGNAAEALAIVRSGSVDLGPRGNAYPDYLRLLIENGRWEETAVGSSFALEGESVWWPDALLARALAQLHFGESELARETLERFDPTEYAELIDFWRDRLHRTGALASVTQLLADATASAPACERLAALRDRFTGS